MMFGGNKLIKQPDMITHKVFVLNCALLKTGLCQTIVKSDGILIYWDFTYSHKFYYSFYEL